MNKITAEMIMSWWPCEEWPHPVRKPFIPDIGDGKTALEILDAEDVSVEDRLWVVLRPEVLGERGDMRMQIFCGRMVLGSFEREFPDDKHPREVLRVKRKYLHGECTAKELTAARDAAEDAFRYASPRATWAAAARKAARDAAAKDAAQAELNAILAETTAALAESDAVWSARFAVRDAALDAALGVILKAARRILCEAVA